jgi:RNA polymerase sigma-70 factor (ECF subfamily)
MRAVYQRVTSRMTHPMVADRRVASRNGELELGDRSAFDRLVATRLTPTFRLARAIVGDTRDAEDATQEAFLSAWRSLPQLRDAGRFDAWFGRIVVNQARMTLRRRGHVLTVPVDAIHPDRDGSDDRSPGAPDPSIEAVGRADALQRAIDRLSAGQRTILALHYLEERQVADIAALLEIPVGTAKWRLHEARGALERAMETQR